MVAEVVDGETRPMLLLRQAKVGAAVLAGLVIVSLPCAAVDRQKTSTPPNAAQSTIMFTEVPATLGHTSNTCKRAMTLSGPLEFPTQILHTGGTQSFGTQFVCWLRDGHSAIISRISLAAGSCPAVSDCACEPAYANVRIVPF